MDLTMRQAINFLKTFVTGCENPNLLFIQFNNFSNNEILPL